MQLRKVNIQRLADFPENWQDIPGYEGYYAAYWKGAILNRRTNFVLTNSVFKNGYVYVTLSINGNRKNKRLHRLIAETYLPNTNNKPEVNHISGNKQNNHLAQLEWSTASENRKHAYNTGLNKGSSPQLGRFNELSARSIRVNQYSTSGLLIKVWPSIAEAGRNGFKVANICKVCKGLRPKHQGYIWKYANN